MFTSKLFHKIFLLILGIVAANVLALYMLALPLIRQASLQAEMDAARAVLGGVDEMVRSLSLDLDAYRKNVLDARKRQIRDMAALGASIFTEKAGELSGGPGARQRAQAEAMDEIGRVRFGESDYLIVSDQTGTILSHPNPSLLGRSLANLPDGHARRALEMALKEALKNGEAMAEYPWRGPRGEPMEKLTYFIYLPAWKLVVGAGASLDEANAEIARRKQEMIVYLREALPRIKMAGSGYLFIFDENDDVIAHPDLPGISLKGAINPVTGGELLQEFKAAARLDDPRLAYRWDSPGDPGNRVYEKIAWARRNKEFGWHIVYSLYEDDLGAGAAVLRSRLAAFTAFILLLSAITAGFMARRMAQPVKELSRTALRIRDGDLAARSGVERDDEIGFLAASFNDMAARMESFVGDLDEKVRERTRELDRKNVLLNLQIAQRKRVEEDLRRSRTELREAMLRTEGASRAKSEFLANVSHEIRTPMNAILGMCGLALSAPLPQKQRERLEIIRSSAGDLLSIVSGILDFSKIEAGKLELDEMPMDLRRTLGEVMDLFRDQVREKGLEFYLDVDGRVPERVFGDPLKLKQILTNLTANAFRFTDQGEVSIRVEPVVMDDGTDALAFKVADTGSGISAEELPGIFEAFTQANPVKGGRRGGTGLGLAISKRLAELMGGGLAARSEPGRGSEFIVTAPLAPVTGELGASASLRKAVAGKRILVAAGSDRLASIMAEEFSRLGFSVTKAVGRAAFRRALAEAERDFDMAALERSLFDGEAERTGQGAGGVRGLSGAALVFIDPPGAEDRSPDESFPAALSLVKPVKPSSLYDAAVWFFRPEEAGQPSGPGVVEPVKDLAGAKVLLVEDIEVNRLVAVEALRMAGIDVDEAEDGREAVKAALRKRYDAILMDLQMPVMNGYEATSAIRALPSGRALPIIAMTALAQEGDRERCLDAGMNDYLSKPVDWGTTIAVLRRWIAPGPPDEAPPQAAGGGVDSGKLVDFAEGLARLGGNGALYRKVLRIFIRSFSGQTAKVAEAIKAGDMDRARAKIHALAGAAGNISANALRLSAKRVEARILEDETDEALALLGEVENLFAAALADIRDYASEGEEDGAEDGTASA